MLAAAEGPYKVLPEHEKEALRLEPGCQGRFPDDFKGTEPGLWTRCCHQEVDCHDYYCRSKVLSFAAGQKVKILESFSSDDDQLQKLQKGQIGKLLRLDGNGDALIRFFEDELDDVGTRHWVLKTTLWKQAELLGEMPRMRASRTVSCMNNCSVAIMNCNFQRMTKKEGKVLQKCMKDCNMEECQKEEECKQLMEDYSKCKHTISQSSECKPVTKKDKEELSVEL